MEAGLFFIACPGRADPPREHGFAVPESRIDPQNLPKAGEKQTGADKQDEGDRDLYDHQPSANHARSAAAGAGTSLFSQHIVDFHAHHVGDWNAANKDSQGEGKRESRADDHTGHLDLAAARDLIEPDGCEARQGLSVSNRQSEQSSQDAQ